VLKYMGRFMQYYREHGKYLERTYDFVERVGVEKLRGVLVDDAEGQAARLDAEIQANGWLSVAADSDIVFSGDDDAKWGRALAKLGVDLTMLSSDAGHA